MSYSLVGLISDYYSLCCILFASIHLSDCNLCPSPVAWLPIAMCRHVNMHHFPSSQLFPCICTFHPSELLSETSCMCLLYLIYLLQESALTAELASLQIHSHPPSSNLQAVGAQPRRGFAYMFSLEVICSISFKLYLTSCACWLYLQKFHGLPVQEDQAASNEPVRKHKVCQGHSRLSDWDKFSEPLSQRHVVVLSAMLDLILLWSLSTSSTGSAGKQQHALLLLIKPTYMYCHT